MSSFYESIENGKDRKGRVKATITKMADEGCEDVWFLIINKTKVVVPILFCPCCGKPEVEIEETADEQPIAVMTP